MKNQIYNKIQFNPASQIDENDEKDPISQNADECVMVG